MSKDINLSFSTQCGEETGSIIINGISFPGHKVFNPLAKIWSSVRKQNLKTFSTSVVADKFTYDDEQRQISCHFQLSFADQEGNEAEHSKLFQNTFEAQVELFIKALLDFVKDEEHGYTRYLVLTQTGADADEIEEMFNEHLASVGLRPKAKTKAKAKK